MDYAAGFMDHGVNSKVLKPSEAPDGGLFPRESPSLSSKSKCSLCSMVGSLPAWVEMGGTKEGLETQGSSFSSERERWAESLLAHQFHQQLARGKLV